MTIVPIKNGLLQADLDADGYTILNLDLTGLGLTKVSVGLGNVDNTSDLNKPVSTATLAALNLKENTILAGTTGQFWRGDKTWTNYGALALQDGNTTLPALSVIGANPTSPSIISAKRSDWISSGSQISITYHGAGESGSIYSGILLANVAHLEFRNSTSAIISTNNSSPLIFGYNGARRMRLMQGLNVGGDGDPGAGCISCYDTLSTGRVLASGATFSGPPYSGNVAVGGTLIVTGVATMPRAIINGVAGAGYIQLIAQTVVPSVSLGSLIYATAVGQVAFKSGENVYGISMNTLALSADRAYSWPNKSGTIVVSTTVPASAAASGVAGTISYASGFLYVCVATDTWERCAISTW